MNSAFKTLKALAAAAYWTTIFYGFRTAIHDGIEMIFAVAGALLFKGLRTPPEERAFRRKMCSSCSMHIKDMDSCGRAGEIGVAVGGAAIKHGCWCPTSLSVLVKEKTCWKKDYGEDRWSTKGKPVSCGHQSCNRCVQHDHKGDQSTR